MSIDALICLSKDSDQKLQGVVALFGTITNQWLSSSHAYTLKNSQTKLAQLVLPKPNFQMLAPILRFFQDRLIAHRHDPSSFWSQECEAFLKLFDSRDLPVRRLSLLIKICSKLRQYISKCKKLEHNCDFDDIVDEKVQGWVEFFIPSLESTSQNKALRIDLNTCNSFLGITTLII